MSQYTVEDKICDIERALQLVIKALFGNAMGNVKSRALTVEENKELDAFVKNYSGGR